MSDSKSPHSASPGAPAAAPGHFIRDVVVEDVKSAKHAGRVATRFPPEPNGYLHIGHAKAIWVNFSLAREFGGSCNLRFDDTNPTTEEVEYVESIQNDIRWLGYQWDQLFYASDYFESIYQTAEKLIKKGKAYVDSLNEEQIREYRGNYYKKGVPSPYRDRSVEENLDLFRRMRAGEFKEGEHVLRAKIDLNTQNMNLRDPVLYRIRYAPHHRTGTKWCIYPMYDYAHPLSDAEEKITHSICTLEFEAHRPLYDWCIAEAEVFPSRQIEFARLNLTYTVMSKRKLLQLVKEKIVDGWDDPRMPTIAGMRRRGYTPEALRTLCEKTGVAKANSTVDVSLLEHCVREDLNRSSPRLMAVVSPSPIKLVIENFPAGEVKWIDAPLHPEDASQGTRRVPFSRELLVERDDFREAPPKDWFRLAPGREVRLRYACLVTVKDVVKDASGEVTELRCTWDPASWGGNAADGRVVRGALHWVSKEHAAKVETRLYDRLFAVENPGADEGRSFLEELNPKSLEVVEAFAEPYLASEAMTAGRRVQFERIGYFCVDTRDRSKAGGPVFNRTVGLKDSWTKMEKRDGKPAAAAAPTTGKAAKVAAPTGATGDKAGEKQERSATPSSRGPLTKTLMQSPPPVAQGPAAATPAPSATGALAEIAIEDFAKIDLRVGVVRSAEAVPEAKKLLKLMVDLGEGRERQIFAGLRAYYPDPAVLVGQRVVVVANLKQRQMKFGLSEGMVLAAGAPDGVDDGGRGHLAITTHESAQPGDKVR